MYQLNDRKNYNKEEFLKSIEILTILSKSPDPSVKNSLANEEFLCLLL